MTGPDDTSVAALLRAAEIGTRAGLRFVYAGNLPGRVGRWENTWCPGCGALLIERYGFKILRNRHPGRRLPGVRPPRARLLGARRGGAWPAVPVSELASFLHMRDNGRETPTRASLAKER